MDKLNVIINDLEADPDNQELIEDKEKEKASLLELTEQEEATLRQQS